MKKNLLILIIGIIIGTTITAGATYVYRASDIGYSPTDENWNVTNANEAISSLKTDVNSLNEYRSNIVESLVDKGVDVNENSSMADIKNGIDNMGATDVYYLGTGNSFDIKSLFPNDYQNFTNDNFIVSYPQGTSSAQKIIQEHVFATTSWVVSKSYNATTGTLTCSGYAYGNIYNSGDYREYAYPTAHVYLVKGDITNIN